MSTAETDRTALEAAESTRIEAAKLDAEEFYWRHGLIKSEWLEAQRSDEESPGTTGQLETKINTNQIE